MGIYMYNGKEKTCEYKTKSVQATVSKQYLKCFKRTPLPPKKKKKTAQRCRTSDSHIRMDPWSSFLKARARRPLLPTELYVRARPVASQGYGFNKADTYHVYVTVVTEGAQERPWHSIQHKHITLPLAHITALHTCH